MKWFKHHTNAHKGDVFQVLSTEFGKATAYAWYFLIVEFLADKWDGEGEPKFKVTMPQLCGHVTATPRRLRRYLTAMQRLEKIKFTETGKLLEIEFPKLLEIRHKDALPSGSRRATRPAKNPLRGEGEENRVEERGKTPPPIPIGQGKYKTYKDLLADLSVVTKDTWVQLYGIEMVETETAKAFAFYATDPKSRNWDATRWTSRIGSSIDRQVKFEADAAKQGKKLTGGWED